MQMAEFNKTLKYKANESLRLLVIYGAVIVEN